jgi:hypothetical protein
VVAADDRNRRPGSQPIDEGVGLPIRERVDDTPTLEVDQDRAVALAAPHTPVVDAHHLG